MAVMTATGKWLVFRVGNPKPIQNFPAVNREAAKEYLRRLGPYGYWQDKDEGAELPPLVYVRAAIVIDGISQEHEIRWQRPAEA